MLKGGLEVIEYVPRQATLDAVPPDHSRESDDLWSRLRLEHRTLTSCAAALAALALHVLVMAPALWADGGSPHSQDRRYRGDTALQWVILAESAGKSGISQSSLPSLALAPIGVADVAVAQPRGPSSTAPVQAADPRSEQADGQSGFGAMYGRYLGQIHARIDRAWVRPRTAIGAPIFQCQVQVDQDSEGRVQAVTLLECNGGARWQVSLEHAIEAASPLPAPPDPAVFVHHLLLAFRATAYAPGASAELYEAPSAAPADDEPDNRNSLSRNAFRALRETAGTQKPRVLELRIEGSKVDVEPEHQ